jgi:hypothetical protein
MVPYPFSILPIQRKQVIPGGFGFFPFQGVGLWVMSKKQKGK